MLPKTIQNQYTASLDYSDQQKLFTKEFYNMNRSRKKRDLNAIALHQHPRASLGNIFPEDLKSQFRSAT
jgi:hypothetical protein